MFASGLMNMAAIVWLGIYWMLGLKLPTTIPLAYQILSALILSVSDRIAEHRRIVPPGS